MIILSPLSWLYRGITDVRNAMFGRGVIESHSLGARTISVGNITTGGTGKTPLVILIASMLADNGECVCILTRGYGRENPKRRVLVSDGKEVLVDARTGGDEPVEMAKKLIGKAVIVADADRVAAAEWAREKFAITAFVLDDGFQHRRAKRDMDIVCIDATDPLNNERVLPAGKLREPLSGLSRADAFVITRSHLTNDLESVRFLIRRYHIDAPIFEAETRIGGLVKLEDFIGGTSETDGEIPNQIKPYAFCGLGNPENFFETLRRTGMAMAGVHKFRDHHEYSQADADDLSSEAEWSGASSLVTTAKDAVKMNGLSFRLPCYIAIAETVVNDRAAFLDLILSS